MRFFARPLLSSAVLSLVLAGGGCSQEPEELPEPAPSETTQNAVESPQTVDESAIAPEPDQGAAFELAVADIDAYAKGLQKENELARMALANKKTAKTDEARLSIMMSAMPQELKLQAVTAAGIDQQRYLAVRESVSHVLSGIEMKSIMIDQAATVDTAGMSEDMAQLVQENAALVQKTYGDPFSGIPVDVAETIQLRHDELRGLLNENLELVMAVAQQ